MAGIGSTLGSGAYVLAAVIAKSKAGPATCLSFFIAAVTSILAGICYAEFGARVPRTGSVYIFSYVTIGEFMAFSIGWTLILEYTIGSASVARAASGYLNYLSGDRILPFFKQHLALHAAGIADYCDPISVAFILIVTAVLVVGVKESSWFNNIFTLLNICVLSFVVIAGFWFDDAHNWFLTPTEVLDNCTTNATTHIRCGTGGFFPFGFEGVVSGAATAFFGFVGFDAIATTGEEVINPTRSIPLAIVSSLSVIFVFYFAVSVTVTMMTPYFALSTEASFAVLFHNVGIYWAPYLITVGALCALTTSLLGALFPIPRIIFSMARDGLIFRPFSRVNSRLQTPVLATVSMGVLSAALSMIFDLTTLADMMSIGTLLAYTLVSACVTLLRYECNEEDLRLQMTDDGKALDDCRPFLVRLVKPLSIATPKSALLVKICTFLLTISIVGVAAILTFLTRYVVKEHVWWSLLILVLNMTISIALLVLITMQPQSRKKLSFTTPLVPLIPSLSILANVYLMLQLDRMTWLRFVIWLVVGLAVYVSYGIWHSNEEKQVAEMFGDRHQLEDVTEEEQKSPSSYGSTDRCTSAENAKPSSDVVKF